MALTPIFLPGYEARDQVVDFLRRFNVRRVADAGERAVLAARERPRDRLATRLPRDHVLATAGDQHALRVTPRIGGKPALRQAMDRLPIALRLHAALTPAHELERDWRRAFRYQRGRALLGQAFRSQIVELA